MLLETDKPAGTGHLRRPPRDHDEAPVVLDVGGVRLGGEHFALIAGPCTVESREQLTAIAEAARDANASMLRGGAYKPRTSPYSFHGLGRAGLSLLAEARELTGLPVVTELTDVRELDAVLAVADVVQVGARNMQNQPLLVELGRTRRPVLLKRGFANTIDELLHAAEYVLAGGNERVILCERGIRTFETAYRFTLDLAAIPVLRARTRLPVVVDPSHAAGRRDLVEPLSVAAAAIGADGIIVEVHNEPERALCDGSQALRTGDLPEFVARLRAAAALAGKRLAANGARPLSASRS